MSFFRNDVTVMAVFVAFMPHENSMRQTERNRETKRYSERWKKRGIYKRER